MEIQAVDLCILCAICIYICEETSGLHIEASG